MGYEVLEHQMRSFISNMKQGEKFFLRDIISNPPAQLGVTLYKEVQNGTIPNVRYLGKIKDIDQYEKL